MSEVALVAADVDIEVRTVARTGDTVRHSGTWIEPRRADLLAFLR